MKPEVSRRLRSRALAPRRDQAIALYEELMVRDKSTKRAVWSAGHEPVSWLRRRLDPASPRGLALTVATLVAASAASILGNLAQGITDRERIVRFDGEISRVVALHRDPSLTAFMHVVAWLGAFEVIVPLGVLISAWFFWRRGHWAPAAKILIVVVGAAALSDVVQGVVSRRRPSPSLGLIRVSGWAFPAERAVECVAFYGLIALLLSVGRPRVGQIFLWTGVGAIVLLVGASRVYLGVHWFSDVVAGYALGGLLLCAVLVPTLLLRRRPPDLLRTS